MTKSKRKKLRYSKFADQINLDDFYLAVGFDPIETRGAEDRGHCLDFFGLHTHGDTTGKLSFNREKRVWGCWVCGGGSLLDFAMHAKNLDSEEATHWIHQFAEGESKSEVTGGLRARIWAEKEKDEPLPFFNPNVLDRWEHYHPWFAERGISETTAEVYRLRYNPDAVKRPPAGKEDEDMFVSPAVILPHFWKGQLVGWQTRWLDERPKWVPKYTNTSSFPAATTIFNYDRTLLAKSKVVIVESVPTVLWLESIGVPAVATFGDSVSEKQMQYLRRYEQGVIISADADKASLKWRDELTEYLGRRIQVLHCPLVDEVGTKLDLADLAPDGETIVKRLIDEAARPIRNKVTKLGV